MIKVHFLEDYNKSIYALFINLTATLIISIIQTPQLRMTMTLFCDLMGQWKRDF